MVNHIVDANNMVHKLINYEVLMNKLYEEIRDRGFEVIDGDEI